MTPGYTGDRVPLFNQLRPLPSGETPPPPSLWGYLQMRDMESRALATLLCLAACSVHPMPLLAAVFKHAGKCRTDRRSRLLPSRASGGVEVTGVMSLNITEANTNKNEPLCWLIKGRLMPWNSWD